MELKNYFSTDEKGNVLPMAACYLYDEGTQNLVSPVYDASGKALSNPFGSGANGLIQFQAADGVYDLRIVKGARDYTVRVQCFDAVSGIANAQEYMQRAETAAVGAETSETAASASESQAAISASAAAASASSAMASAGSALADAAAADSARIAAETARDAAQLSAGVYATTAAGLSATTSGQYFSVPSSDSSEFLVLYRNNAGTAQEVKRYPSAESVTAVGGRVPHRGRRGWIHAMRSSDGKLGLGINRLGRVIFGVGGDIVARLDSLFLETSRNADELAAQQQTFSVPRRGLTPFRILDNARTKVALEVTRAGRLIAMGRDVLAELDLGALLRAFISTKSGGRSAPFAVRDAVGRTPLFVTRGGRTIMRGRDVLADVDGVTERVSALESGAIANKFISPSKDITLLGDSQINGAGPTPWRTQIVGLISQRNYRNLAIGGQTSTQIAARFGAIHALISVANDQIPASGAVAVTACRVMKTDGTLVSSFTPLTSQGAQTLVGTLMGVPGTLTRTGDGSYSFTRTTNGVAVSCPPDTPLKPAWADYDLNLLVIGLGRNNISDLPTIKRDIEACVAAQRTIEKRLIILTVTNGGPITPGEPTTEGIGSTVGDNVIALESWAESRFTGPGVEVVNVRKLLMPLHNGSADDLADVAAGTVPRSLRIDAVHYSEAAHAAIANHIASIINTKGW